MYFSHLMLCDRREGLSSQERYEQALQVITQAPDQGDDFTGRDGKAEFAEHRARRLGVAPAQSGDGQHAGNSRRQSGGGRTLPHRVRGQPVAIVFPLSCSWDTLLLP